MRRFATGVVNLGCVEVADHLQPFRIGERPAHHLGVSLQAIDQKIFELAVEQELPSFDLIDCGSLLEVGIRLRIPLRLLEHQFISLTKAGTEPVIHQVDHRRELDLLSRWPPGAHLSRTLQFAGVSRVQRDSPLADLLQAVIPELNIVAEVVSRRSVFRQPDLQKPQVGVQLLQIRILERDDLAEEAV